MTQKTVWIYGTHAVQHAIANPRRRFVQGVVASKSDLETWRGRASHVKWCVVDKRALEERFGLGAVHQGVAVEALALPSLSLEDVCEGDACPQVLLMLDQVTDPHNVGAIMRSAAAFGVTHLIMQDRHSPDQLPTLAKVACGALEHVDVITVVNLTRALEYLKTRGYWSVGLDERGDSLESTTLPRPMVLVLGAEGKGLRPLVAKTCDMRVCLPTAQNFPTLNVSAAAAIALYAATRRA